MEALILATIITASGSIVLAFLSFYLVKKHEIKTGWQKEKIKHYKDLISSLSDLATDGKDKEDANMRFALAFNTIALVAPQSVITALMRFHDEVKFSNKNKTVEKHDILLKKLLVEIRKDIDLTKRDKEDEFVFHLIGSNPGK